MPLTRFPTLKCIMKMLRCAQFCSVSIKSRGTWSGFYTGIRREKPDALDAPTPTIPQRVWPGSGHTRTSGFVCRQSLIRNPAWTEALAHAKSLERARQLNGHQSQNPCRGRKCRTADRGGCPYRRVAAAPCAQTGERWSLSSLTALVPASIVRSLPRASRPCTGVTGCVAHNCARSCAPSDTYKR